MRNVKPICRSILADAPEKICRSLGEKRTAEELPREQRDMPEERREKVKAVLETINLELKRK